LGPGACPHRELVGRTQTTSCKPESVGRKIVDRLIRRLRSTDRTPFTNAVASDLLSPDN
jgi:hypothetical protein